MGVFLGFLCIWSLEITVLALITAGACYAFRKQPGNTHAALWTAALCVIWILPLAPIIIPEFISPPAINTVIVKSIEANQQNREGFNQGPARRSPQNAAIHRTRERASSPTHTRVDRHGTRNGNKQPPVVDAQQYTISNTAVSLLFSLWCVGVVLSLLRWARSHLRVQRLLRKSHPIDDSRVVEEIERTRQLLFINGRIRLRTADSQTAPFVIGLLKPTIFFPTYMLKGWSQRERLAVVAHELAHVRRYDLAAHHAMRLLRIVLWFLPPVWWMQRELHRSQDAACDECAAVVLGSGPEFGRALAQLAESCLIADPVFPALGLLHSKPSLITRLENIMNARIPKLSRLSLTFKFALLIVSCTAFIGIGILDRAAASQTLSVEFLGDYSGPRNAIAVVSVAYAPPYYVVVGKQNDQRIIQYYRYDNGSPALAYTVRPDGTLGSDPDAFLRIAVANERFLVLFYVKNNAPYYIVYDHSQEPKLEHAVYLTQIGGTVSSARLYGSELYFINKKQNGTIYRHSLDVENPIDSQWNAPIPEHIITTDFDLLNGEFLLTDGFGDDGGDVDPDIGVQTGVARAWIDAENHLQIDLKRWFTNDFQPFVHRIQTVDSTAIVSRDARMDTGIAFSKEILIVDWSDGENPKVVQTLKAGTTDTYTNNGRMEVYGSLMAVPTLPEELTTHPGIDLYQYVDGMYQLAAQLPNAQGRIALGPEFIMNAQSNKLTFYDITNLTQPTEKLVDIESPFYGYAFVPANLYLYAITTEGSERQFITLDTAVPFSVRIVDRQPIPEGKAAYIRGRDGLLSLTIGGTGLIVYKIQEDGSLGHTIDLPLDLMNDRDSPIGIPLFNDSLFIATYAIAQPDGKTTPDPTYPELHIYKRFGDEIAEQASSVLSLTIDSRHVTLSGDSLFEFRDEYTSEIVDGSLQSRTDAYLYTYSLENPERPLYQTKFLIPMKEEVNPVFGISINDVAANGKYIAYCGSRTQSGIVDISDLQNPKHTAFLPGALCVFWYENLLALGNADAIVFYKIDNTGAPTEIARIDNAQCRTASVSNNRLFVGSTTGGIDIYELNMTPTGVLSWTLH